MRDSLFAPQGRKSYTLGKFFIAALVCASLLFAPHASSSAQQTTRHHVGSLANRRSDASIAQSAPTVRPYQRRASREALAWADAELRRMSLEEKIGQLVFVGINAAFLNQESDAYRALRRQVEENHIGGIILFRGPVYESVHLVNRMQAHARHPLLISADLEAGAGMRFDDTVNFPW
ncbi:MAG: glycoside hydrolase family 3 N-terminal domain-containing protein, partial [Pyrinomonadaceae bacterium]